MKTVVEDISITILMRIVCDKREKILKIKLRKGPTIVVINGVIRVLGKSSGRGSYMKLPNITTILQTPKTESFKNAELQCNFNVLIVQTQNE